MAAEVPDLPPAVLAVLAAGIHAINDAQDTFQMEASDQLGQIFGQLDALYTIHEDILTQINALEGDIEASLETIDVLSRNVHTLPEPHTFGEDDWAELWVRQMRTKLKTDGEYIGSLQDQFNYVFALLAPEVQGMVFEEVETADRTQSWDPEKLLTEILRSYGEDDDEDYEDYYDEDGNQDYDQGH
ncbi:hypothetical protein F4804DRAFT_329810 [Jackrogersella minutella]|nr:hypothetical protein F4804DRAFT_329810 [Jackrogersella minutella]